MTHPAHRAAVTPPRAAGSFMLAEDGAFITDEGAHPPAGVSPPPAFPDHSPTLTEDDDHAHE